VSIGTIASQAFSPNKIAGLKLWLDASDLGTIIESGGLVSEWNDKSINGINAVQLTGTSQPVTGTRTINGHNVMDFDGANDLMALDSQPITDTQARSLFIVGFADNSVSQNFLVSLSDTGGPGGLYRITAEIGVRISGANRLFTADAVESGQAAIITATNEANSNIELNVSNFQIYKNGVLLTGGTSTNPTTAVNTNAGTAAIGDDAGGTNSLLDGVLAQLIIYDRVPSTFERQRVETYLANKWGIALP